MLLTAVTTDGGAVSNSCSEDPSIRGIQSSQQKIAEENIRLKLYHQNETMRFLVSLSQAHLLILHET